MISLDLDTACHVSLARTIESYPFFPLFLAIGDTFDNLAPGVREFANRTREEDNPRSIPRLRVYEEEEEEKKKVEKESYHRKGMSPLNRGSPLGSRILPAGARPLPPPRFGPGRPAMSQRIPLPPRMPSPPPRMRRMPPMSPMFGPGDPRQRIPPPPPPPRQAAAGGGLSRLNGVPPLFPGGPRAPRGHHGHHLAPIAPPMVPRGSAGGGPRGSAGGPRGGPLMRPWPRRMPPPQMMPPMRPMRYNTGNGSLKVKPIRNAKKINNRAVRISRTSSRIVKKKKNNNINNNCFNP